MINRINTPHIHFGERVRTRLTEQDKQMMRNTAIAASGLGMATAVTAAGNAGGAAALPGALTAGPFIGTNLGIKTAASATQLGGTGLALQGPQSVYAAFIFRVLDTVGLHKVADWLADNPALGGVGLIASGSTVGNVAGGAVGGGTATPF